MTLKMTTAQVVETSVTVTNSSFQNYTHPDDHTTRTTDTPGFKPFTIDIKIPIIFHNLRGYDSHFIMQEIGEITKKHTVKNKKGEEKQVDINSIPNNIKKYMAFMLGKHLLFIDSFQFMSSSLDKLASNLPDEAISLQQKLSKKKKNHYYEAERCVPL